jgi:hypothetical protein
MAALTEILILAQPFLLRAKPEGRFLLEGQFIKWYRCGVETGGNNPVACRTQLLKALPGVVRRLLPVPVKMNPFGGPHGHIPVQGVLVAILYDMEVLDTKALA